MKEFKRASLNLGTLEEFSKKNESMFEGFTQEEIKSQFDRLNRDLIFMNSEYQVNVDLKSHINPVTGDRIAHLIIKRIDNKEIDNWRIIQDIKNIIIGDDIDAIELYPDESRNVKEIDAQTHLWCMPRGKHFELGWFTDESVSKKPELKIVD